MAAAKFIVKEKQFHGGMKWGAWKTKSSHETLREALNASRVCGGFSKRAVFYKGWRVSDGCKLEIFLPQLPFGTDVVAWAEAEIISQSEKN